MRKAFTLIELIITLVILSIVSYIASGLIAKIYIGYNQTNSIHKANLKVEIAITQIVNRLEYAIDGTVVKRKSATDNAIDSIDQAPLDYEVLEWVGWDKDGFEANNNLSGMSVAVKNTSAWSGFCNINASTPTTIVTPGSDLLFANDIIMRLSNGKVNFTNSLVALFFPGNYDYTNIGYKGTTPSGLGLISAYNSSSNMLYLSKPISRITEHYKLAWSAYAVVPTNYNKTEGTFDLVLRYNFRPWKNVDYNDVAVVKAEKKIAKNVTVFKTYATQNRIHIKLCVKEKFGIKKSAAICREKVVFK